MNSICRICLEEQNENNDLINPCECKGCIKYMHKSCLLSWIRKTKKLNCEICMSRYRNLKVVTTYQPTFLDFISREPQWILIGLVNAVPLIYDIYYMINNSSLYNKTSDLDIQNNSPQSRWPVAMKIESGNMSFFISLNKLNLSSRNIPITLPIELLNLYFFLKDFYSRFNEFKILNTENKINFL